MQVARDAGALVDARFGADFELPGKVPNTPLMEQGDGNPSRLGRFRRRR